MHGKDPSVKSSKAKKAVNPSGSGDATRPQIQGHTSRVQRRSERSAMTRMRTTFVDIYNWLTEASDTRADFNDAKALLDQLSA
jgi:hypothetical protein